MSDSMNGQEIRKVLNNFTSIHRTLLVAAELIMALVIDQFGWFDVPAQPTSGLRLVGVVLLIVAASLISR